jgi:type I restriction enzyme S subunit
MTNWPTKKLVDVCEFQRGSEPGSKTYNEKGGGIRFIRVADVSKQRTSPIWTKGKNLVICNKNDILMTFDGSPGVVFRGIEGAISSGIRIIKPKNSKELLDDFLFYVLQTNSVQNTVKKYTIGASIWHASRSIPHIEIPLPPLEIQKQIVAGIEELFEKIDKAIELRKNVKEENIQIFELAKQKIFSEAIKKYNKKEIKDFAIVKGGKRLPKGDKFSFTETDYPYIRVADFKNFSVDISNLKYISEKIHKKIARYTISKDDVYISIAGTIGLVGIIPDNLDGANLTENAAKIVLKNKKTIDKKYLVYYLSSSFGRTQIDKRTNKVGQPKLALMRIETIKIPIPPLSEQKKIVDYLDNLRENTEKLRKLQEEQLEDLEELKKSILDKVFKGELL